MGKTKQCRKCERVLPVESFYFLNKELGYRRYICIDCTSKQNNAWSNRNRTYKRKNAREAARHTYYADLETSREKSRQQTNDYNRKLRQDVLDKLGRVCPCGCADERALHIDHVNGGGTKHKKENFQSTAQFHRHVLDAPAGLYQILCASCNWRKRLATRKPPSTKVAAYSAAYAERQRRKAVELLGGMCSCGETDYDVLHFDHKDGGGGQDRKTTGRSHGIANDVLKHGKKKYQLLCCNCNEIKKHECKE